MALAATVVAGAMVLVAWAMVQIAWVMVQVAGAVVLVAGATVVFDGVMADREIGVAVFEQYSVPLHSAFCARDLPSQWDSSLHIHHCLNHNSSQP